MHARQSTQLRISIENDQGTPSFPLPDLLSLSLSLSIPTADKSKSDATQKHTEGKGEDSVVHHRVCVLQDVNVVHWTAMPSISRGAAPACP